MIDRFRVGVITTPHGVRGEVKVFPTTDEPRRFKKLKEIILDTGKGERILKIRSARVGGKFVILGFEGFDTVESVTPLRGAELYVDRKDAIPLKKGEYFIPDLLGLEVIEEDGTKVGTLTDVLKTGANDVYAVETPEGKQLLLPVIPDCIREVSPENGYVKVYMMPGLRDL